jgi:hypothetical protein
MKAVELAESGAFEVCRGAYLSTFRESSFDEYTLMIGFMDLPVVDLAVEIDLDLGGDSISRASKNERSILRLRSFRGVDLGGDCLINTLLNAEQISVKKTVMSSSLFDVEYSSEIRT